jgi:hypothetical protein
MGSALVLGAGMLLGGASFASETSAKGTSAPAEPAAGPLLVKAITLKPSKEAVVIYKGRPYTVRPGDTVGTLRVQDITARGVMTAAADGKAVESLLEKSAAATEQKATEEELVVTSVIVKPIKEAIVELQGRTFVVRPGDKLGALVIRDVTSEGIVTAAADGKSVEHRIKN